MKRFDITQPRCPLGLFAIKQQSHPDLRLESTDAEEFAAEWEARYVDSTTNWLPESCDRPTALLQAADDNLNVAKAAQASSHLTANDLVTLMDHRLIVNAGALANPNVGRLPFTAQATLIGDSFPEERLVGARNPSLHPELLDALTRDDEHDVRRAAHATLAGIRVSQLAA